MFSSCVRSVSFAIDETSPPAQNARPVPVTRIAPTFGSALQERSTSIEPRINSALSAFSLSGRLSVSDATPSSTFVRITGSAFVGVMRLVEHTQKAGGASYNDLYAPDCLSFLPSCRDARLCRRDRDRPYGRQRHRSR